jgi:hypothetical protein
VAETHNPLRTAMETRDPQIVVNSLAPDAIFRSPIFSAPFKGQEEIAALYTVVFQVLGEISYVSDVPGDPHLFVWRSDVAGELLEGVDMFTRDEHGRIDEVTVFLRPLRGVAAFVQAAAGQWAENRSGRAQGAAMRAATAPPTAVMKLLASTGPRMMGLPRRPAA